jgi:hypothetical protein
VFERRGGLGRPVVVLLAEDGRRRRPPAGPALTTVEEVVTTGNNQLTASLFQRRAARAANAGTSAILSSCRCSQRMPGGRCGSLHQMVSPGVTMRSTRKSCTVLGRGSSTTWSGWTVVASTVSGRITLASIRNATSRSENPPPLPMRAPWRFTATLPQTTKSTEGSSVAATFRPALAAPSLAAASQGSMLRCVGLAGRRAARPPGAAPPCRAPCPR